MWTKVIQVRIDRGEIRKASNRARVMSASINLFGSRIQDVVIGE